MRAVGTATLLVGVIVGMAVAQQPAPEKTYASAADVQALITKAKADRKGDAPTTTERILSLAPYNASLEYRAAVGPAAVHVKEAEFFYVIDGSGTMVTGGKLINETKNNPDNPQGTGIEGGNTRTVSKGDFIVVPENTAHWFSKIDGVLVLMSLHAPRPVPSSK
jgi:mannose-6-phosphate isomerase-like protein (cupin superfamily)